MNFSWKSCFMRYGLIRENFMESCFMRYFKLFFQKKSENVLHGIFCLEKKYIYFSKKYMSTPNFPKIPKIALRKPCDHFCYHREVETCNIGSRFLAFGWLFTCKWLAKSHSKISDKKSEILMKDLTFSKN